MFFNGCFTPCTMQISVESTVGSGFCPPFECLRVTLWGCSSAFETETASIGWHSVSVFAPNLLQLRPRSIRKCGRCVVGLCLWGELAVPNGHLRRKVCGPVSASEVVWG